MKPLIPPRMASLETWQLPQYVHKALGKTLKLQRPQRGIYLASWEEHGHLVQIVIRSHSAEGARHELKLYVGRNYNVQDGRSTLLRG